MCNMLMALNRMHKNQHKLFYMFTICTNSLKIAAFSGEHLVWLAHLLLSYSQPTKLGVQV